MEKKILKRFNSFFWGGFECADHINRSGDRINLLEETQHHIRAEQDYQLLADLGIKVVREGVCWSSVEIAPYKFNFSSLIPRMEAAEILGIQIVWDLCHFGYPDGIYPTHPRFFERFMSFCRAFTLFHKSRTNKSLYVVPINEISFLSWHSGDMRGTVPFAINSGFDIKYHLCKAAIEGIKVIKQTDKKSVVVLVEPLVKVHPGDENISEIELEELNSHQFQAMDIISGRICRELGGSEDLYDIVGLNYYHNNQWDHFNNTLPWPSGERKLTPLSNLLEIAYKRYNKPVVISETGHFGVGRAQWIEEISLECKKALSNGVNLLGICIYPVIDRPDWDNLKRYHDCGIWDLDEFRNRIPDPNTVTSVKNCIRMFENIEEENVETEEEQNGRLHDITRSNLTAVDQGNL